MTAANFFFMFLLFSPLVGVVGICLLTDVRRWSLLWSLVIFLFCLLLLLQFDNSCSSFQFVTVVGTLDLLGLTFVYGLDGISIFFVLLTTFLIPICFLASWESIKYLKREYYILFFLTEFLLLNVFSILDLFLFYVIFESILVPVFLIIGIWGSRSQKIYAAYQFFLYTFAGSIFFLLAILFIINLTGTSNLLVLRTFSFSLNLQYVLWFAFFCSFVVKIPMIPVHIWLPEAHAEAPTAGSVLLAGILLKLGTYGLLRFSLPLFPEASLAFTPLIFTLSVISVVYASAVTLRQTDLKKAIAYSSIAHMGLAVAGLFSNSIVGLEGGIYVLLSHGLVSSGLFLCVGVLYDRYHTRNIRYYGGLVNVMPLFGLLFFILSLANMGLPGTSAFIGEISIVFGLLETNSIVATILVLFGGVLSAGYSLWLYARIMFGPTSARIEIFADLNEREFLILGSVVALVIIFGFSSASIFESLHTSVTNLLLK